MRQLADVLVGIAVRELQEAGTLNRGESMKVRTGEAFTGREDGSETSPETRVEGPRIFGGEVVIRRIP